MLEYHVYQVFRMLWKIAIWYDNSVYKEYGQVYKESQETLHDVGPQSHETHLKDNNKIFILFKKWNYYVPAQINVYLHVFKDVL